MASGSDAWLDERRSWGIVSALAASVVAAMSVIDLDEIFVRDVVVVAAAVGVYLVYGAVSRFPAWAPFGVAVVATTTLNTPDLRTEGGNGTDHLVVVGAMFGVATVLTLARSAASGSFGSVLRREPAVGGLASRR